jgi:hypothetical protein
VISTLEIKSIILKRQQCVRQLVGQISPWKNHHEPFISIAMVASYPAPDRGNMKGTDETL